MTEITRQLVFWLKGDICLLCGSGATVVHHIDYETGDDLNKLYPLCKGCHYWLHFRDNGYFRDLEVSKDRLKALLALPTDTRYSLCRAGKKQAAKRYYERKGLEWHPNLKKQGSKS